MQGSFKIPYSFIDGVADTKVIAVYIKLKSVYNKSIYYNYNIHNVSVKSGVSEYLLRRYLKIIIANGWASVIGNHLHIHKINKIAGFSRNNVTIQFGTVQEITNNLRFSHIKQDYLRQKFMEDVSFYRIKAKNPNRIYKKYKGMKLKGNRTSYRRIAKKCNISLAHSFNMVQKWKGDGILDMSTRYKILKKGVRSYNPTLTEFGLVKVLNGNLVLVQGSSFSIAL